MEKRYLNPKFYILKFTLIFFVISILMGVGFGGKINAQDADVIIDRPNQGFTISGYDCPDGFTNIKEFRRPIVPRDKLISSNPSLCLSEDKVAGVINYSSVNDSIEICNEDEGEILAIDTATNDYHTSLCCPVGKKYFYDIPIAFNVAPLSLCCQDNLDYSAWELVNNPAGCEKSKDSDSMKLYDNKFNILEKDTFQFGDKLITCEANGCITDLSGQFFRKNDSKGIPYESFINCTSVGGKIPAVVGDKLLSSGYYCVDGANLEKIDQGTVNKYGGINQYLSCQAETDDASKQDCLACFEKNESGQSAFVWTSLGCVDTSKNGFVTRVYQIGLGIVGGFGVWKIMSAAFMYQQADPAKHEQAREEITSVFWALILMVGAIFILNYIGVNVLGIFSTNFF